LEPSSNFIIVEGSIDGLTGGEVGTQFQLLHQRGG
jgi:hypothetical protein